MCVKVVQGIHKFFFAKLKPILMVVGVECSQVPVHGVLDIFPVRPGKGES